jgi:hypothetical protein
MKINLMLMCIVSILSIGIVSAEVQTLGHFTQGSSIQLKQSCGTCSYNNITSVMFGGKALLSGSYAMTKVGTDYNYTFSDTQSFGQYIVCGVGDLSGVNTSWCYDFFIGNMWIPLIIAGLAILLLGFGLLKQNAYFGLFSAFLFIILGIYSMSYGLVFLQDKYTEMLSDVIIGLGVIIGFASVYEMYILDGDD